MYVQGLQGSTLSTTTYAKNNILRSGFSSSFSPLLSASKPSDAQTNIINQMIRKIQQSSQEKQQLADAGDIDGINEVFQEKLEETKPGSMEMKADLIGLIPGKSVVKQLVGVEAKTDGSVQVILGDKDVGGYAVEFGEKGQTTGKIQASNNNNTISVDENNQWETQVAIPLNTHVTVGVTHSADPTKPDVYNLNVGPVQLDVVPPDASPVLEYMTRPEVLECGLTDSCD